MQNGYALCTPAGLDAIADHLGKLDTDEVDELRDKLCIGIHRDIEVTDAAGNERRRLFHRRSVRRSQWPTLEFRIPNGKPSRRLSCRLPTRQRCGRPCITLNVAPQTWCF